MSMGSYTVGEILLIAVMALFYSLVICTLLFSSYKVFLMSREVTEIKQLLIGIRESLDQAKKPNN
ncbi:MAG TPA: hypothetical protein DCP63_03155 [Bacteroidetes bacterium]|nr:hypothetical protein [Bacteroidota bacterium]